MGPPRQKAGPKAGGKTLLRALKARVGARLTEAGDRLETKAMTGWVSFKSRDLRRVFAEVRPHRHNVEAFILPPVASLTGADGVALPSPPTQGWGWFQSKFHITRTEDVGVAVDLLIQSYVLRREMTRGGHRRTASA